LRAAAAARTAWLEIRGAVLKFRAANPASKAVLGALYFTLPASHFTPYPNRENRRKKNQQIKNDKPGKSGPDHGFLPGLAPQWKITVPHRIFLSPFSFIFRFSR
jgi:hypothetical protein